MRAARAASEAARLDLEERFTRALAAADLAERAAGYGPSLHLAADPEPEPELELEAGG